MATRLLTHGGLAVLFEELFIGDDATAHPVEIVGDKAFVHVANFVGGTKDGHHFRSFRFPRRHKGTAHLVNKESPLHALQLARFPQTRKSIMSREFP